MDKSSKIKSVLITGCSSGIGLCIAHGLQSKGYRVFASARSQQDVKELRKLGFDALLLDLSSSSSIKAAIMSLFNQTENLYALINNGAYGQAGALEDISREAIIAKGIVSEADYLQLEEYTRALFKRGSEMAAERGLILVDTKYEFGKLADGTIVLIDEIHTPDSSRYFYADGYQERQDNNEPQRQLSKEFVREWLMENGFQGKEGQHVPEMTDDFVEMVSNRYQELFEKITGKAFDKVDDDKAESRIYTNVEDYLAAFSK